MSFSYCRKCGKKIKNVNEWTDAVCNDYECQQESLLQLVREEKLSAQDAIEKGLNPDRLDWIPYYTLIENE